MTHAEDSTTAKGTWTIFDSTGYQGWKTEMKARLIDKKCFAVVNEGVDVSIPMFAGSDDEYVSDASDPDVNDDAATLDRKKKVKAEKRALERKKRLMKSGKSPFMDNRAKVLLLSAISKPIRQLVSNAESAQEIWNILREEYESTDYVSVGRSIREFYSKDLVAGASVEDHINRMKTLWVEINSKWKGSAAGKKLCGKATHCDCANNDRVSSLEFAQTLLLSVDATHEALVLSLAARTWCRWKRSAVLCVLLLHQLMAARPSK